MRNPLISLLFPVVLLCPIVGYAQQQPPPPEWSITITAVHDSVKAGENLRVKVVEGNISKKDLLISTDDRSVSRSLVFEVFVRDAQGALLPMTEYGRKLYVRREVWSNSPLTYSHPGEVLPPELIDVSKLYDLKPGKYTLQAQFYGDYNPHPLLSNTIMVTVTQ